ncbi:MAG TPA: hypothetical protein VKT99_00505 [Xanthobacteraceae bacterium]|nr:hypothetical protein [Xanthobacteraceae bacterium]
MVGARVKRQQAGHGGPVLRLDDARSYLLGGRRVLREIDHLHGQQLSSGMQRFMRQRKCP